MYKQLISLKCFCPADLPKKYTVNLPTAKMASQANPDPNRLTLTQDNKRKSLLEESPEGLVWFNFSRLTAERWCSFKTFFVVFAFLENKSAGFTFRWNQVGFFNFWVFQMFQFYDCSEPFTFLIHSLFYFNQMYLWLTAPPVQLCHFCHFIFTFYVSLWSH